MSAQKDYTNLKKISQRASLLSGISGLLAWDQETYMPPDAAAIRAAQLEILASLIHKERTGKPFSKALSKLVDLKSGKIIGKDLEDNQKGALREWRRDYLTETALPAKFVADFAKLTSQSLQAWRTAKDNNQFQTFAPFLEKIVTMSRRKADYIGFKSHPYDALLDLYEPEMTTAQVDKAFKQLQQSIAKLLAKILQTKQIQDNFLFGKFSQEKQLEFGKTILDAIGYNMQKGRVDISSHPFSSAAHPTDSRVTTRIHPTSLVSNIFVLLHEGGHALYEMGLPQEHYGTPLCQALSLGLHESQSRWWETRIGQSLPFWKFFLPKLKALFKGKIEDISLRDFYRAINKVQPSLIRVEADEVTYPLHVILRFELEKALMEGTLKVKDVPEAWNAKMKELLGIIPQTDSEGCLQDIHWSMGGIGYFPTYTLGTMYASHLFQAFEKTHPDWQKKVSKGELLFINNWLNKSVHQYGRQYTTDELLKKSTGSPFNSKAFTDYLNQKYQDIYQF